MICHFSSYREHCQFLSRPTSTLQVDVSTLPYLPEGEWRGWITNLHRTVGFPICSRAIYAIHIITPSFVCFARAVMLICLRDHIWWMSQKIFSSLTGGSLSYLLQIEWQLKATKQSSMATVWKQNMCRKNFSIASTQSWEEIHKLKANLCFFSSFNFFHTFRSVTITSCYKK